jgi:hypothetical protein
VPGVVVSGVCGTWFTPLTTSVCVSAEIAGGDVGGTGTSCTDAGRALGCVWMNFGGEVGAGTGTPDGEAAGATGTPIAVGGDAIELGMGSAGPDDAIRPRTSPTVTVGGNVGNGGDGEFAGGTCRTASMSVLSLNDIFVLLRRLQR